MGKIGKTLALFLTLMVAMSCLTLNAVKPASAQTAPTSTPNPQTVPDSFGSWDRKATVPSTDHAQEAAVVNGIIYIIGENTSNYAYNPSTGTWTTVPPMPTSRVCFAIADCDNKIYVIGGFNRTSIPWLSYSLNEVYDPSTNTWTTAAPMPTARGEMNAATVNGKIYVIGGNTGTAEYGDQINVTEIYDPATDSWNTGASMPYAVDLYASAAVDNNIYVIGGHNDASSDPSSPLEVLFNQIYNTENNSWSWGSAFPGTRVDGEGAGATTGVDAPKRIYVFGGIIGYYVFSDQSFAYDPATDSWIKAAAWPNSNTTCHSLVAIDDILYAFAGYGEVWQFTPIGYQPTVATIWATTDNGSNVELTANGNITSSQMSNIHISMDPTAAITNMSFTLTGQDGEVGFSNITIPKSDIPYGNVSTVYIDGQPAENQSCTQDASNYYVWYMSGFSTHNVSIVFANPTSSGSDWWQLSLLETVCLAAVAIAAVEIIVAAVKLTKVNSRKR